MALYKAKQFQNMRAGQMQKATYGDARVANTNSPQMQQQQQSNNPFLAYQQSKQQTEAIEKGIADAKKAYQWYSDRNWDPGKYDGVYNGETDFFRQAELKNGMKPTMTDAEAQLMPQKMGLGPNGPDLSQNAYNALDNGTKNAFQQYLNSDNPMEFADFVNSMDKKALIDNAGTFSNAVTQGSNIANAGNISIGVGNAGFTPAVTSQLANTSLLADTAAFGEGISVAGTPIIGTVTPSATLGTGTLAGTTAGAATGATAGAGAGAAAAGGVGALGTAGIGLGVLGLASLLGWI